MNGRKPNGQVTYSSFAQDGQGQTGSSSANYYHQPQQNQAPYQDYLDMYQGEMVPVEGILEILPDYGILRHDDRVLVDDKDVNASLPKDVYISLSQIKRFALRVGDKVKGQARPPKEGERYLSMLKVEKVEDLDPEEAKKRPNFQDYYKISKIRSRIIKRPRIFCFFE